MKHPNRYNAQERKMLKQMREQAKRIKTILQDITDPPAKEFHRLYKLYQEKSK